MESSFCVEFLGRSWDSFLSAIGTTGLGFFASSVAQFFVLEVATWVVILVFRGKDAMMAHKKQNFAIGALAYFAAVLTIYVPIYGRQMKNVDSAIWNEANTQPVPRSVGRVPLPPSFADEFSPASIKVSLIPQTGFLVDLGGPYKFDDKKQYMLLVNNSAHVVGLVDMEITFPYPVEAKKVIKMTGIRDLTFTPTFPLINLLGAQLENGGCLGRWSYHLRARGAASYGMAAVSLIFNGHSARSGVGQPPKGYIDGSFEYSYRSKMMRSGYYATLEAGEGMIIKMSEPQGQPPSDFKKSSGFTVLEGPCIPDSSLLNPPE